MTVDPTDRGGIEGFPTGLSWLQQHRAARLVASASVNAADCALLLAALGIHPEDGRSGAVDPDEASPGPPVAARMTMPLRTATSWTSVHR